MCHFGTDIEDCVWLCFFKNKIQSWICSEKGEVSGDHYKLLPVDLRDIQQLDDMISLADMDPRYAYILWQLFSFTAHTPHEPHKKFENSAV